MDFNQFLQGLNKAVECLKETHLVIDKSNLEVCIYINGVLINSKYKNLLEFERGFLAILLKHHSSCHTLHKLFTRYTFRYERTEEQTNRVSTVNIACDRDSGQ